MSSLARLSGGTPLNRQIKTPVLCIYTTEVDIKHIVETAAVALLEAVTTDTIAVRHTKLMARGQTAFTKLNKPRSSINREQASPL